MKTKARRYGENSFIRLVAENIAAPADVEAAHFQPQGFTCFPAATFYQFETSWFVVTYMILGDSVYCYESDCKSEKYGWRKMLIQPDDIRKATQLIRRVA